jgi:hypothetical protein
MSPYYDQTRGHREPEDIAGALVLLACAVVAFAWYIAASRLHIRLGGHPKAATCYHLKSGHSD